MRVKGIVWLGTRTERFDETRRFVGALAASPPLVDEPGLAVFDLPNGDRLEVFGPDRGQPYFEAPVAEFLVDDVASARAELEALGAEPLGPVHHADDGNSWAHFRAPDGHVYGLTSHPGHRDHDA